MFGWVKNELSKKYGKLYGLDITIQNKFDGKYSVNNENLAVRKGGRHTDFFFDGSDSKIYKITTEFNEVVKQLDAAVNGAEPSEMVKKMLNEREYFETHLGDSFFIKDVKLTSP